MRAVRRETSMPKRQEGAKTSKVRQTLLSADGRQVSRASRALWLLRLLVVIAICTYLPLEAFNGDAVVGFDEAVWQNCESFGPSNATVTQTPGAPDLLGPGAQRLLQLLQASRLCARSRIVVEGGPLHPPLGDAVLTGRSAV